MHSISIPVRDSTDPSTSAIPPLAPQLLLIDINISIIWTIIGAFTGVFMLSTAVEGYWRKQLPLWLRIVVGIAAVLFIYPNFLTDIVGITAFLFQLRLDLTEKSNKENKPSEDYSEGEKN